MNKAFTVFFLLSAGLVFYSLYLVFMYVPNEVTMGAMQRILYFHAGSATACYVAVACLFFGSLGFLSTKKVYFDRFVIAGTEVGLLFASITLFTGMIWGQAAWNTPFRFEPRLVSTLILWLMLIGGILLRKFSPEDKQITYAAGIGFLSTIMVPLVVYSIELLPHVAQVHPQVVGHGGLRDPRFGEAFGWSITSLSMLAISFMWIRILIRKKEEEQNGNHA